jgi:hypothetical protein
LLYKAVREEILTAESTKLVELASMPCAEDRLYDSVYQYQLHKLVKAPPDQLSPIFQHKLSQIIARVSSEVFQQISSVFECLLRSQRHLGF